MDCNFDIQLIGSSISLLYNPVKKKISNFFFSIFNRIFYSWKKSDESGEFGFLKSYVFVFSSVPFARGWNIEPIYIRGRIAFLSVILAGVLLYMHWEAQLISKLTSRKISLPFSNLAELMEKTDRNIILYPGSFASDMFKFSDDPIWQKAWEERINPYLKMYPRGGLTKLQVKHMLEQNENSAIWTMTESGQ